MQELVHQLGINWKLLLSQGANFLILLIVLTLLVYRPLAKVMEERRKKIEFGLVGAEEAERRLKEIDQLKEEKMTEADKNALKLISEAEKKGQKRFDEIIKVAEEKADGTLAEAARIAEHKKQEELDRLFEKANALIKEAIVKMVELDPKYIDDKLISRAAEVIKEKA
ncbi:MAG: hypothetical protein HY093_03635 [Candidatus Liptonbacteria bacterium]|nr:hypothetical protein [Candidatus Liptonbacteria bacterium]